MIIFENDLVYVERHDSLLPWLKVFTKIPYKELSDCDEKSREAIFRAALIIEKEMIAYFKPDKINWASFGNMLPRVHMHIQARFKEDSHFPEPTWGAERREFSAQVAPMEPFIKALALKMQEEF